MAQLTTLPYAMGLMLLLRLFYSLGFKTGPKSAITQVITHEKFFRRASFSVIHAKKKKKGSRSSGEIEEITRRQAGLGAQVRDLEQAAVRAAIVRASRPVRTVEPLVELCEREGDRRDARNQGEIAVH